MPVKKTRDEIIEKIEIHDSNDFYNSKAVNYSGYTIDSNEKITEVIAEYLLRHPEKLEEIEKVYRTNYFIKREVGMALTGSTEEEQNLAIYLSNERHCIDDFGKVIAYQVPRDEENKLGKIDLLSVSETNNKVYIIELKRQNGSDDTLLRCILEIFTYWKQVNATQLQKDYLGHSSGDVVPAVLICENSKQHKEYKKIDEKLEKLIEKLGVEIFILPDKVCKDFQVEFQKAKKNRNQEVTNN